jgi:sugar lactone lactonase YvrE
MKTHTGKILVDNTRGLKFTESPRWRNGKLWFLDIHDKRIKTADLDGRIETAVELGFIPNGIVITPDGKTLIVAETMGHLPWPMRQQSHAQTSLVHRQRHRLRRPHAVPSSSRKRSMGSGLEVYKLSR